MASDHKRGHPDLVIKGQGLSMQASKKTGFVTFLVTMIFLVASLGLVPGKSAASNPGLSSEPAISSATLMESIPGSGPHDMNRSPLSGKTADCATLTDPGCQHSARLLTRSPRFRPPIA
ncbi:hypothetical protein [Kiloniella laminariae]|uniref:hypothetical protein n=1 Tax=Kiloniella laminariae TaxID=454162 RepID=UPI00036040D3|nr:hypothetical protein [Kiloniella laminariae]